jgi:hypothetical protein
MLLSQISSRQFADWLAYYSLEPFGEERADLRAGIVASVVNNRWRGKGEKALSPIDFMPYTEEHTQTAEEQMALFQGFLKRG